MFEQAPQFPPQKKSHHLWVLHRLDFWSVAALAERIAAKTDTSGDHHRWLGATGADGTPQIRIDGRLTTVRRVIWEQAHGPLPDGATVAACPDDARCVRLGHLSLGRKDRMSAPVQTPTPRQRGRRGAGSMREVRPGVWELSFSDMGTRRYRTIRGTRSDAASEPAREPVGGGDAGDRGGSSES